MFLSRDEVRALDRRALDEYGLPGVVLMENAGRGTAELLVRLGVHGRVVICCGRGNNGGDGFVIARHLDNHSIPVRLLLFASPVDLTGDSAINYQTIARSGLTIDVHAEKPLREEAIRRELALAEWVVDALFGTGLTSAVRPPLDRAIALINESGVKVLAVDLPSGLDCDTGQPLGATVRALHTATMAAWKKGFADPAARAWLGQIHLIDIGVPRRLLSGEGTVRASPGCPAAC
jgi:NAD(P)H-hydrate epimerase